MDIRIKTSDYEMTPETAQYLDDRLEALEKILGEDGHKTRCEVEIGRDGGGSRHGANMWFAEIHLFAPGKGQVYARNNAESVNIAIEDAKEEAMQQLRKNKRLHRRVLRKGGAVLKRFIRFGRE